MLIGLPSSSPILRPSVSFRGSPLVITTNDLSSYTFSGADIGPAKSRRFDLVGVFLSHLTAPSIAGVTLGGNAMTGLGTGATTTTFTTVRFFGLQVDAGATADIVVTPTTAAGTLNVAIAVWALYDLHSFTPIDPGASTANPGTDTLTVPGDGIGLAFAANASVVTNYSWSGLNENFDATIEASNGMSWSGASIVSDARDISITATRTTGGTSDHTMKTLSFR